MCLDEGYKDIFKVQLRALLRAGLFGNLKIMFPMISSLNELLNAKKILREVEKEFESEDIPYAKNYDVGIMIEIPSAAIMSDLLAKEVDFFSIGTNDLTQYTMAADRMNSNVSYIYSNFNPAVS